MQYRPGVMMKYRLGVHMWAGAGSTGGTSVGCSAAAAALACGLQLMLFWRTGAPGCSWVAAMRVFVDCGAAQCASGHKCRARLGAGGHADWPRHHRTHRSAQYRGAYSRAAGRSQLLRGVVAGGRQLVLGRRRPAGKRGADGTAVAAARRVCRASACCACCRRAAGTATAPQGGQRQAACRRQEVCKAPV